MLLRGRQENAPGTVRALALAEQRLTEAAAELARRGAALQQMEQERNSANAQVQSIVSHASAMHDLQHGSSGQLLLRI